MWAPYSYRRDPACPAFPDDRAIVVFDGVCALCSRSIQFLLRHDRAGRFRLATAQSLLGTALYTHYGLRTPDYDSFVLIADGTLWLKSDAVIRVLVELGFPRSTLWALKLVPRAFRDALYDLVARNRFRLFGRRATCYVPEQRDRERFLA